MSHSAKYWIALGAVLGAAGVGLGAFGAHGLEEALAKHGYEGTDLTRRLEVFDTAVRYHLIHALAIVLTGILLELRPAKLWQAAAGAFTFGVFLFSGLLYVLTVVAPSWNWLGAVVPLGGVSLIVGWLAMAIGSLARRAS